MQYVDGFVLPVPKKNIKAYTALAKTAARSGSNTAPSITVNVSPKTSNPAS